jgi:hypothetical protein
METETFSTKLPLHLLIDYLGAVRGYDRETKPSRIIARLGAPMSAPGLGRVKTSAPKALREAGIPIVGGTFPGLSPRNRPGGSFGPQGGTLIAAISGWILMMFMTRVRL